MLANQWQDAPFRITSLGDRVPVGDDDEIVILAAPDPQGTGSTLPPPLSLFISVLAVCSGTLVHRLSCMLPALLACEFVIHASVIVLEAIDPQGALLDGTCGSVAWQPVCSRV